MTVLWLGRLILAALIAVCLLQLLRGRAGALTPLCSLAVCAVMVGAMLAPLSALWQKWQTLLTRSGVELGGAAAALVCAFPLAEKALSLIGALGA